MIIPLGQWILAEGCREAQRWPVTSADGPPLVIAVNLSARQFQQPHLHDIVGRVLAETGLDPSRLKLEVAEAVVLDETGGNLEILVALKALGVKLAIDDFGTGYSGLSTLKESPVDTLKIDRGFIDGLRRGSVNVTMVRAVLALAGALDIGVTAEGVETAEQLAILDELGCDRAKGYVYARPQSGAAIEALLSVGDGFMALPDDERPRLRRLPGPSRMIGPVLAS